jgi:hypothetical protein
MMRLIMAVFSVAVSLSAARSAISVGLLTVVLGAHAPYLSPPDVLIKDYSYRAKLAVRKIDPADRVINSEYCRTPRVEGHMSGGRVKWLEVMTKLSSGGK